MDVEELYENNSMCDDYVFVLSSNIMSQFSIQSEDSKTLLENSNTHETLTFVDNNQGIITQEGYSGNPVATDSQTTNTNIQGFLSRPVLIDTRSWSTSTNVGFLGNAIEPWRLFMSNSFVASKLRNYAFIRAKLCVKVVINGTPFHFGLTRVSYEPSCNAVNTGFRKTKIRTNPTTPAALLVPHSQLPGTWLTPAANAGGEIHVPFFYHKNWLPLTSQNEVGSMGILNYYVAFPLALASATGSGALTIDTFAWLEDVELSGTTNELILQSEDEYGTNGIVSAPASAIARIADGLSSAPIIGRFARATHIGASAVASIASMFGWTNVPVIDPVHAIVPATNPSIASCEISTPVQKLTLDPKQELSVDPSLHGVGKDDEMIISHVVQKESLLTIVNWTDSTSIGTVLFNCNVNPVLNYKVPILNQAGSVTVANRVYETPLSYIASLFDDWRGDICFEVQVICTKFHKGRLRIAWDPLGNTGAAAFPDNTVYTTILDIGENNKAVVRVPYHQARTFQRVRASTETTWTAGSALACNPLVDNGLLNISVVTPLVSPVTPQTVGIKISVYGAANLEFANPSASVGIGATSCPPSFFDIQSEDEVTMQPEQITFGDIGKSHPERYGLNFGEHICSLRALLHRYSVYDVSACDGSSATRAFRYAKSYSRLPPVFGYDPNATYTAVTNIPTIPTTAKCNFVPMHPISYISNMFGAHRGGINYSANVSSDLTPYVGDIRVQRVNSTTMAADRNGSLVNYTGTTEGAYRQWLNLRFNAYCTAGAAYTNSQTNGSLTWYAPMMTGNNFNYPSPETAMTGNSADLSTLDCTYLEIYAKQQVVNTTSNALTVITYAATAPDFTCLWWLCCPTVDYYTTIPVAG